MIPITMRPTNPPPIHRLPTLVHNLDIPAPTHRLPRILSACEESRPRTLGRLDHREAKLPQLLNDVMVPAAHGEQHRTRTHGEDFEAVAQFFKKETHNGAVTVLGSLVQRVAEFSTAPDGGSK